MNSNLEDRVVRGGSWDASAIPLRGAGRYFDAQGYWFGEPESRNNFIGFRCVKPYVPEQLSMDDIWND